MDQELKKSPGSPALHALLADNALRSGRYDLALQQYQLLLGKGMRSPHLRERIGTAYEFKGNLNEAIASFQAAKELAPHDPTVWIALADVQRLTGRKPEAVASYRSALALAPDNASAMNHLAYLLVDDQSKLEEAQSLVERALKKTPKQPDFEDTLGLI